MTRQELTVESTNFPFRKNVTPERAATVKDVKVLGRDKEFWIPSQRESKIAGK